MKRSLAETILGAVVLFVAIGFLTYSYGIGDVSSPSGYEVMADFTGTGGLQVGDAVQVSGVKVGSVTAIELVPGRYLARVHMDLDSDIKLPLDTVALISSESLLGGKYMLLEPGGDPDMIEDGGMIEYTQAPQNLEQLLGQFIFSMQDSKGDNDAGATQQAQARPPQQAHPQAIPPQPAEDTMISDE